MARISKDALMKRAQKFYNKKFGGDVEKVNAAYGKRKPLDEYRKNINQWNEYYSNRDGEDAMFLDPYGKAVGGDNHFFYESTGRDIEDYDAERMSPDYIVDENGNKFVEFFHWTPKENVPGILKNGLVESLGADAKHFQRRKGLWTSFGPRNPMEKNYNNNAGLDSPDFGMVPIRGVIPYEEWKAMHVDHTGETLDDQVMVFRSPEKSPYGKVILPSGNEENVVIPPQYIEEYKIPKNWTMKLRDGSDEFTLPGWVPGKPLPQSSFDSSNEILRSVDVDPRDLYSPDWTGNIDNDETAENFGRAVNDALRTKKQQDDFKENNKNHFTNMYKRGNIFYNDYSLEDWNNKADWKKLRKRLNDSYSDTFVKKLAEEHRARTLGKKAHYDYVMGTKFKTPYDLVMGMEVSPKQQEGSFGRGFNEEKFLDDIAYNHDYPRVEKFKRNLVMDHAPISAFSDYDLGAARSKGYENLYNKRTQGDRNGLFVQDNPVFKETPTDAYGYAFDAGLRNHDVSRWWSEKDDKLPTRFRGEYDESKPLKESSMEILHREATSDAAKKRGLKPATMYRNRTFDFARPLSNWGPEDYAKVRDQWLYEKEAELAAWTRNANFDPKNLKNVQPIIDERNRIKSMSDNEVREKILESRHNELVNDWKNKFSADSLDRVIGHHIGRKIGKYRASRGKYGLDK